MIRRVLFLLWAVWSACVLWGEAGSARGDTNPWRLILLVGVPFGAYQLWLWCWEGRRR